MQRSGLPEVSAACALDRLHARGLISDPAGKASSVNFSAEGQEKAAALLESLFGKAG